VKAFPFQFDNPDAMAESLAGVRVLYNTYWIRFDRDKATHDRAVANTRALIRAAEIAGVQRFVHISITNPDRESPLPYFRGKALLEEEMRIPMKWGTDSGSSGAASRQATLVTAIITEVPHFSQDFCA
jgi:hypothetical protein